MSCLSSSHFSYVLRLERPVVGVLRGVPLRQMLLGSRPCRAYCQPVADPIASLWPEAVNLIDRPVVAFGEILFFERDIPISPLRRRRFSGQPPPGQPVEELASAFGRSNGDGGVRISRQI